MVWFLSEAPSEWREVPLGTSRGWRAACPSLRHRKCVLAPPTVQEGWALRARLLLALSAAAEAGGADPLLPPGGWSQVQAALASSVSAPVATVTSEPQALPQRHSSAVPRSSCVLEHPC